MKKVTERELLKWEVFQFLFHYQSDEILEDRSIKTIKVANQVIDWLTQNQKETKDDN